MSHTTARNKFRQLADDDSGILYSVEKMLMLVLVSLGFLAGLAALRDGIVQEIGDAAFAVDSLDQTYTFTVQTAGGGTQTSTFTDSTSLSDPANAAPAGIVLDDAPVSE